MHNKATTITKLPSQAPVGPAQGKFIVAAVGKQPQYDQSKIVFPSGAGKLGNPFVAAANPVVASTVAPTTTSTTTSAAKKRNPTTTIATTTTPVTEYVWQDEDGTIHQRPPAQRYPPQQHTRTEDVNCSGWWLWLIVFLFFVAFLGVFFIPWRGGGGLFHGHHHHDPELKDQAPSGGAGGGQQRNDDDDDDNGRKMRETAANCTADETFNANLHLCVLTEKFPHAVSEMIVDQAVSPCQDIYRHACGKWMDTHHNENRGFSALAALNDASIAQIVEDKSRQPANLNAFYSSCLVTLVQRKQRQNDQERDQIALDTKMARDAMLGQMLNALVSLDDLPIVFARMSAVGFKIPFSLSMMGHPEDKGVIPMFAYDGFSVREDMERDWVVEHFELLHGKGSDHAQRDAETVIAMITEMNALKPDEHDSLETSDGWNRYMEAHTFRERDSVTWADFSTVLMNKGSPSRHVEFDWDIYMGELGKRTNLQRELHFSKHQQVWAVSRTYFERWRPRKYTVEQWRTFVTFSVLYHTHDFFPKLPSDAFLHTPMMNMIHRPSPHKHRIQNLHTPSFMAATMTKRNPGQHARHFIGHAPSKRRRRGPNGPQRRRRRRRRRGDVPGPDEGGGVVRITKQDCVDVSKYMLPGLVSKEFLARHFAAEEPVRQRVRTMMERLRIRFMQNIESTPWMDDATKQAQREKIATVIARVIHPNEWTEETFELGKEMDPKRYLRNLLIIQEDRVRRNLALWSESNFGAKCDSKCRDKTTPFGAPLFTVNAWYNPDRNIITIPAGILQPPFFDMRMSEASMYARLGWVVSHEFSHAMDVHGINYDKYGVVRDTWSKEARERYMQRSSCLVRSYPGPVGCPEADDVSDYGRQTLGENFADHNGVRLAFETLFIDGNNTGADRSQRAQREFFMAASQMWCSVMDLKHTCESAKLDVHSSADFRVRTTFSHLPYFASAFGCKTGTPMHREDRDRCVVLGSEAREYAAIARLRQMTDKNLK